MGWFTINGVAPGNYRAYLWEDLEPYAYFDPDFVNRLMFQANGSPVRVEESSTATVSLALRPSQ